MEINNLPKIDHTPANLDEQSRILLRAADLLEKHGLAKHCQRDSEGRMCMAGAIIVAAGGTPETFYSWTGDALGSCYPSRAAWEAAMRVIKGLPGCTYGPANWNNAPERTKDEVVAKLRAVALSL